MSKTADALFIVGFIISFAAIIAFQMDSSFLVPAIGFYMMGLGTMWSHE